MNNIELSTKKFIALILLAAFFGGVLGALFVASGSYRQPWSFGPHAGNGQTYSAVPGSEEAHTIDVVERANPAVVSIIISKDLSKYNTTNPDIFPFGDFFQFRIPAADPRTKSEMGLQRIGGGSGFVIEPDGLIVTNRHVVADEDAVFTVRLSDGTEYEARVLAKDPIQDIALLKIDAKDLKTLTLGDSDQLKMGQSVMAIGYALAEFGNTVTRGVVSGIGRRVEAADAFGTNEVLDEAIQTDAAINPGNSGGPLLNLNGDVVGINTAVSSQGQLVGFAIPINSVKQTIESVRTEGRIIRPWIGVRYIPLTKSLADLNDLKVTYGALIIRGETKEDLAVIPDSPADKVGLVENDIILEINGNKLQERNSLTKEIGRCKVGEEVVLKILRKGEEKDVKVTLEEFKIK